MVQRRGLLGFAKEKILPTGEKNSNNCQQLGDQKYATDHHSSYFVICGTVCCKISSTRRIGMMAMDAITCKRRKTIFFFHVI
jgi:hypothetical protein